MNEADRQASIEAALTVGGWLWTHFRPAWSAKGYRTALSGHPGFPDIVAVHPYRGEPLFLEVKADKGTRTGAQIIWAEALIRAGADYWLVDNDEIRDRLLEYITGGKVQ